MRLATALTLLAMTSFMACSKSTAPPTAVVDSGPDNAVTQYGQALANDLRKAQSVADRANRTTARQEKAMGEAGVQGQ